MSEKAFKPSRVESADQFAEVLEQIVQKFVESDPVVASQPFANVKTLNIAYHDAPSSEPAAKERPTLDIRAKAIFDKLRAFRGLNKDKSKGKAPKAKETSKKEDKTEPEEFLDDCSDIISDYLGMLEGGPGSGRYPKDPSDPDSRYYQGQGSPFARRLKPGVKPSSHKPPREVGKPYDQRGLPAKKSDWAVATDVRPRNEIDHIEYPKRLKGKSDNELRGIIKDAQAALKAMPNNPKAGYYADEINYAAMELHKRRQRSRLPRKEWFEAIRSNLREGGPGSGRYPRDPSDPDSRYYVGGGASRTGSGPILAPAAKPEPSGVDVEKNTAEVRRILATNGISLTPEEAAKVKFGDRDPGHSVPYLLPTGTSVVFENPEANEFWADWHQSNSDLDKQTYYFFRARATAYQGGRVPKRTVIAGSFGGAAWKLGHRFAARHDQTRKLMGDYTFVGALSARDIKTNPKLAQKLAGGQRSARMWVFK